MNELLKFFIENYIVSTSRRVGMFLSWDVLGLGTIWALGGFEAWDVLKLGCFGVGTFWGCVVLGLGRSGVGTF